MALGECAFERMSATGVARSQRRSRQSSVLTLATYL